MTSSFVSENELKFIRVQPTMDKTNKLPIKEST